MPVRIDFDAPFDVQTAQARAQKVVLAEEYYSRIAAEKRKYAITVSDLAKLDQVQAVADKLAAFQLEGKTLHEFKKWAKTQNWNLPAHRLETIYRNAVQTAYQAGHWRDFEESKADRPYLMYDAINDSRVRPSHLAMDGIIKPVDDAFWLTRSPQCGHRCRCTLRSLSRKEAMEKGGVTQNVPEDAKADAGWGGKPGEWGKTLERVKEDKLGKLPPGLLKTAQAITSAPMNAYEIAKSGGKNAGLLRQLEKMGPLQLQKTGKSLAENLQLHRRKIDNPSDYVPDWDSKSAQYQAGLLAHWGKELQTFEGQILIIEMVLYERSK